jgi:hypothetical protein
MAWRYTVNVPLWILGKDGEETVAVGGLRPLRPAPALLRCAPRTLRKARNASVAR